MIWLGGVGSRQNDPRQNGPKQNGPGHGGPGQGGPMRGPEQNGPGKILKHSWRALQGIVNCLYLMKIACRAREIFTEYLSYEILTILKFIYSIYNRLHVSS